MSGTLTFSLTGTLVSVQKNAAGNDVITFTPGAAAAPSGGTTPPAGGTTPPTGGTTPPTGGTNPPTGGTTPPTGGTTPPLSTNVYPLAPPVGISGNTAVNLGNGPDTLNFQLCYGDPLTAPEIQFAVVFCGIAVAAPLTLTSPTTNAGGIPQVFTIKGDFQHFPSFIAAGGVPTVTFQGINGGFNNLSVQGASFNFNALISNTIIDSRSSPNGGTNFWVSNNANPIVFVPAGAAVTAPPPAPPTNPFPAYTQALSTVTGATINGSPTVPATLPALIAATPVNGVLKLPSGTINATASVAVAGITIEGGGPQFTGPIGSPALANGMHFPGPGTGQVPNPNATIISCLGIEPTNDKAVFLIQAAGITFQDLTVTGAMINDNLGANAAAFRPSVPPNSGDPGCTLTRVEWTQNQMGVLTGGNSVWTLTDCYAHNNGVGSTPGDTSTNQGLTHEFYANGVASATEEVVVVRGYFVCGLFSTHAFKSRCAKGSFTDVFFSGSLDSTGSVAGTTVDTPNGGLQNFTGCTFDLSASQAVTGFFGYAMEGTGAANDAIGTSVSLLNCKFTSLANPPIPGFISNGGTVPTATLNVTGSTTTDGAPPAISGFATVTGTITAATTPA